VAKILTKSIQHSVLLSNVVSDRCSDPAPLLDIQIAKIIVNGLCEFLNEINKKLKSIDVDLLEFDPEYPLLSRHQLLIHPLHLLPAQASDVGEVIDIIIVSCWRKELKWNLVQE
jgi:hypothetical protein